MLKWKAGSGTILGHKKSICEWLRARQTNAVLIGQRGFTDEQRKDPESRQNIMNCRKGIRAIQHLQSTFSVSFTALCSENF